jgi:hypothetical protein
MPAEEIYRLTYFDPWFVEKIREIVVADEEISTYRGMLTAWVQAETMQRWKQMGFADARIAVLTGGSEDQVRQLRKSQHIEAVFARWIPAAPSSKPIRRISTRPMKVRTNRILHGVKKL